MFSLNLSSIFLPGLVYDVTGRYSAIFLTVGGIYIVGFFSFLAIPLIRWRREKTTEKTRLLDSTGTTHFGTFNGQTDE